MNSILKEAFDLLKDIPEEDFTTGNYYDQTTKKSCGLGWFVRKKYPDRKPESISDREYDELSFQLRRETEIKSMGIDIADVNNGWRLTSFPGTTPKQRIMALFNHFNIN